ncbi:CDP-diacylglycerol--glycerol-3-phosphate 3-phosphatidyltransferase [Pseudostreptobacillus hongkongensis]|uniref:CDP-diacylglycerol--glycerol-3-phosphate 3-phosphatidyltransferase n=1 Tax=Pseudostreptobacillus hongkongensis TaxID=1162717 RepID=UPI000833CF98|nr:CDP-diacylglycerol--glycerol-3-phosphate 3-phosphatidyltransferase [Pseudostreptobacillus hongkongensis]
MIKLEKLNLPNKLTVLRLVLTPVLILFMTMKYENDIFNLQYGSGISFSGFLLYTIVLGLFVLIAVTDFLDGYIARRDNLITNFGKLMDPIADKVFVFSVCMVLVKYDLLSLWLVLILLAREFVVVGVRVLIMENSSKVVPAINSAKLKTLLQMFALTFILLFGFGKVINSIVMLPAVVLSIVSMMEYLKMASEYFWKD